MCRLLSLFFGLLFVCLTEAGQDGGRLGAGGAGDEDGGGEAAAGQLKAVAVGPTPIACLIQDLVRLVHVVARILHIPVHS